MDKFTCSNLVQFVKPSRDIPASTCNQESKKEITSFNGEEIKNFYTELVNSHSSTRTPCKEEKRKTRNIRKARHSQRTSNDLFKTAQYGDVQATRLCLNDGVDVNSVDSYGWTALMCASCAGHKEIVQLLLDSGARSDIADSAGRDACTIALQSGHKLIAQFLTQAHVRKRDSAPSSRNEETPFYCSLCELHVQESSKHFSSTVHLFNQKLKPKLDTFIEHSNNKGYQLMVKSGWDGQKGLGPEGQGQKYPVKTVLKRDRKCLGSQQEEKPKITHFAPRDTSAVNHVMKSKERKMSVKTLSKRALKSKERKNKRWEKNLRAEFNSF